MVVPEPCLKVKHSSQRREAQRRLGSRSCVRATCDKLRASVCWHLAVSGVPSGRLRFTLVSTPPTPPSKGSSSACSSTLLPRFSWNTCTCFCVRAHTYTGHLSDKDGVTPSSLLSRVRVHVLSHCEQCFFPPRQGAYLFINLLPSPASRGGTRSLRRSLLC